MMNYYEQLYDINFFSGKKYVASVGNSSVTVEQPGNLRWNTWRGNELNLKEIKRLYFVLDSKDDFSQIAKYANKISNSAWQLFFLLLCEEAYRKNNKRMFFGLARLLRASQYPAIRLKIDKMTRAKKALSLLTVNDDGINQVIKEAVDFVKNNFDFYEVSNQDVKVECPVKKDFDRLNVFLRSERSVKNFYQKTGSYILELTAANYQVETLFNYHLIIEVLKQLGVKNILDYGAGIGTFLHLAYMRGINSIYADLQSKTKEYAEWKFKKYKLDIDVSTINRNFQFSENIDCIVCTEVLEHIFEPETLVRQIHKALPVSGIFVVSESFDYVDEFCTHLPRHKGKGGKQFNEFLQKVGFQQIKLPYITHPAIHVKIK